jgi:polyisoprenoid-binding protein YceI
MRTAVIAAALCFAFAGTAMAQEPGAPPSAEIAAPASLLTADSGVSLNPADAPAGAYDIDARHVSVVWRVRHTGIGVFVGRFDRISGTLNFNPEAPAESQLEVLIDANSVSTGILDRNGERAFDGEIAEVLGAGDAPEIRFVSTGAIATGANSGLVRGDLTLNGETHPATLEVGFHGGRFVQLRGKHVLAFSARTIIDRRDWEVGSLIFNRFAGDEVEIVIEAELVKN